MEIFSLHVCTPPIDRFRRIDNGQRDRWADYRMKGQMDRRTDIFGGHTENGGTKGQTSGVKNGVKQQGQPIGSNNGVEK